MKHLICATALSLVVACDAVGPDYVRPEIAMARNFAAQPATALRQAADDHWWRALGDPRMSQLVERGMGQNLDIEAARARILEADALLRTRGIDSQFSGGLTLESTRRETGGVRNDQREARLDPRFVIDLFGGSRREAQQAEAELWAAVNDEAAARLAYQLSVVRSYLDARFFQASSRIQSRSVANRRRVVESLEARLAAGDETRFALRRAEAELALERARLPEFELGFQTSAFALATLLAEPGDRILAELSGGGAQPVPAGGIDPGVPGALLRNRPDIRAAEARLAATVAAIGVAEAQLYPSLSIGGTVTIADPDRLVLGPALSFPLLDRAVREARRDAARARAEQAEIAWRQTVLAAVEEVQANLARTTSWDRQANALAGAVRTYEDATRLSRDAFAVNAVTLFELLDAEGDLTSAQLRLANARLNFAVSWAQLNVAIGQGWAAGREMAATEPMPDG